MKHPLTGVEINKVNGAEFVDVAAYNDLCNMVIVMNDRLADALEVLRPGRVHEARVLLGKLHDGVFVVPKTKDGV